MYRLRFLAHKINTRSSARRLTAAGEQFHTTPGRPKEATNLDSDPGPIIYSKSPASKYKARTTRTGISEPRLWYEPYVLLGTLSVFLIYFGILREENDIDEELKTSLYSRISGLEEVQLRLALQYNEQHGLETKDIIERLKELEGEKEAAKADG